MTIDLFNVLSSKMLVLLDEPMALHTTMKVGGPADLFAVARTAEQARFALSSAREAGVPLTIIGNGSNIIVRDGGIRGVVLHIAMAEMGFDYRDNNVKHFCDDVNCCNDNSMNNTGNYSCNDGAVAEAFAEAFAEAGCSLSAFVTAATDAGLMGLEFAHGIPGTVGGAICMNAGAYGGEIGERVLGVEGVTRNGEPFSYTNQEAAFGYRTSAFQKGELVVLSASFALAKDDGNAKTRIASYAAKRRDKQPLAYPSAGSVFKRPEGHFAGALIEAANLKGLRIGGATVSEKHAGFIINDNAATAADVLALIERVREKVFANSRVMLETEVRIIGER